MNQNAILLLGHKPATTTEVSYEYYNDIITVWTVWTSKDKPLAINLSESQTKSNLMTSQGSAVCHHSSGQKAANLPNT